MKKFLLGGFASVAMFAGPAVAADMPVKARPAPPVVEYNWTGCYVGGNVGWKEGRFRERIDTPAAPTQAPVPAFNIPADFINFATSATSGVVGGQGGCRWQTSDRWGFDGRFDLLQGFHLKKVDRLL
jgi:outer membrane immunogenic protein